MKKPLYISAAALALMLMDTAYAGGFSNFGDFGDVYVGGSYGQVESGVSADDLFFDFACDSSSQNCNSDSKSSGYGIHAGIEINDQLSIEVGAVDLGETTVSAGFPTSGTNNAASGQGRVSVKQSTQALTAAVVGRQPIIDKVSIYGKAGIAAWQSEAKMHSASSQNNYPSQSIEETGIDPFVGIGVEYKINEQFSVRAGVDRFFNVGSGDNFTGNNTPANLHTVEDDLDYYSVGVSYFF